MLHLINVHKEVHVRKDLNNKFSTTCIDTAATNPI